MQLHTLSLYTVCDFTYLQCVIEDNVADPRGIGDLTTSACSGGGGLSELPVVTREAMQVPSSSTLPKTSEE